MSGRGSRNPTPWRIDRWRDKGGQSGINILDADGLNLAGIVGQIADNELDIAKRIVAAVNARAEGR